jgi:hypothetical protein
MVLLKADHQMHQKSLHQKPEPEQSVAIVSPLPLDIQVAELSHQLRTAQDEIGQIRLERQEQKKPWWRQTAIVISVLGLLLSSGFSIYTAMDQVRQRKANALDSRLSEIVDLRMDDIKQSAALATNLTAYRSWNSVVIAKRAMLIDAAVSAVHDLHDNISATAAFALGSELIEQARYTEAEKVLNLGLKAATAAQASTANLTSVLAEVYLIQGSPLYDPPKGRILYHQAIDSFSNRIDYYGLNSKLTIILWWASAEAGIGNPAESNQLIQLARAALSASPLPSSVKAQLVGITDSTAKQIQQANTKDLYDAARLFGNWRLSDSENQKGSLIIALPGGSSMPTFARDQIEKGILADHINGTIFVTDANHMRLDWNVALILNRAGAPMQIAGYSNVSLHANGILEGTDYPLGLPSTTWTAKKLEPAK